MAESNQPFPFNLAETAFVADGDFLASVIIRTVIITFFALFVIRWMGHKGLGQLSMYELILVIGLGTAIGDPMIYQEVSLVHAFVAVVAVVALFKAFDYFTARSRAFGKLTTPKPILLAKDGKAIKEGLKDARLSSDEYQSYMRLHGIRDISEVEESYLELNGQIRFLKYRHG